MAVRFASTDSAVQLWDYCLTNLTHNNITPNIIYNINKLNNENIKPYVSKTELLISEILYTNNNNSTNNSANSNPYNSTDNNDIANNSVSEEDTNGKNCSSDSSNIKDRNNSNHSNNRNDYIDNNDNNNSSANSSNSVIAISKDEELKLLSILLITELFYMVKRSETAKLDAFLEFSAKFPDRNQILESLEDTIDGGL